MGASLPDYFEFLKNNYVPLVIYATVLFAWLLSACFSASIAENRMRNPWVHFVVGLIIPILYPLIILFGLPTYSKSTDKIEVDVEDAKHIEGPPPVEAAPPVLETAAPGMVDTAMIDSPEIGYDQRYFKQIAFDMAGNHRGPFEFTIKGEKLKVERILEAFKEVVLIEFASSDGKMQSIRIPYRNIDACIEV